MEQFFVSITILLLLLLKLCVSFKKNTRNISDEEKVSSFDFDRKILNATTKKLFFFPVVLNPYYSKLSPIVLLISRKSNVKSI